MSVFARLLVAAAVICGLAAAVLGSAPQAAARPFEAQATQLPTLLPVLALRGEAPANPSVPSQDASLYDLRAFLNRVPIMPEFGAHVREVYRRGQAFGLAADAFALVGDCNTDSRAFLFPLDQGNYDLGPYADLQDVVDVFAGSFGRDSVAAEVGYSAHTVLDRWFADPARCEAGESPLACEYRRTRPAAALIMFGANDVRYLTTEQHVESMRQIIEESLAQGVIPIVSTFSWCERSEAEEKALELNVMDVQLAWEYDVPLVNFWRAAQALPDCGMITETHLTSAFAPGGQPNITFGSGEERLAGYSLRNLLTLQVLDDLRQSVLE